MRHGKHDTGCAPIIVESMADRLFSCDTLSAADGINGGLCLCPGQKACLPDPDLRSRKVAVSITREARSREHYWENDMFSQDAPTRAGWVTPKLGRTKDREEEPRIKRIKRMSADRSVPIRSLRRIRGYFLSFRSILNAAVHGSPDPALFGIPYGGVRRPSPSMRVLIQLPLHGAPHRACSGCRSGLTRRFSASFRGHAPCIGPCVPPGRAGFFLASFDGIRL